MFYRVKMLEKTKNKGISAVNCVKKKKQQKKYILNWN